MALRRVASIAVLLASSADAFLLASRPALSFSRRAAALMSEDPLAVARAAVQEAEEAEAAALAELAKLTSPEEAAAVASAVSTSAAVTNSTQPAGEKLVNNPVAVAAGVALIALTFLQGPTAPPSPPPKAVAKKAARVSTQAMSQGDVIRKQAAEKQAKAAANQAAAAKAAAAKAASTQAAAAKAASTQAMSPGDVARKQASEKQ